MSSYLAPIPSPVNLRRQAVTQSRIYIDWIWPLASVHASAIATGSCETFGQTKSYAPDLLLSSTDRNCRPTWQKFQPQGGKEYTIHSTHKQFTHLAGPFWVLRKNLWPVAPNQEKPHTSPYHSLIYISTYHCPPPSPQQDEIWQPVLKSIAHVPFSPGCTFYCIRKDERQRKMFGRFCVISE
jgi:hypothetical protein